MNVEQRCDDLLLRMFRLPPMKNKDFVGRTVRIPRRKMPKRDNSKPVGFYNAIPGDSLLAKINAVIPRGIRSAWRDDLVQDLALAIVSGEIPESALSDMREIGKIRNRVIARYPDRWAYMTVADEAKSDEQLAELLSGGESHDLAEVQKLWSER